MSRTQTPIDMTVANRIAAGSSQKRWLAETLTPEGLDPTDGKYGRYSRALWRRIAAFVDNLTFAGYAIQELPLGPDGSSRVVMTGYVPAAAPLINAIRANASGTLRGRHQIVSRCQLLAWSTTPAPRSTEWPPRSHRGSRDRWRTC